MFRHSRFICKTFSRILFCTEDFFLSFFLWECANVRRRRALAAVLSKDGQRLASTRRSHEYATPTVVKYVITHTDFRSHKYNKLDFYRVVIFSQNCRVFFFILLFILLFSIVYGKKVCALKNLFVFTFRSPTKTKKKESIVVFFLTFVGHIVWSRLQIILYYHNVQG